MLGKTNIITLKEGGTVTDVEDLSWVRMQAGTRSDFVKAVFQNGYLAALTADGNAVFTNDGEYWAVFNPEYADCRLNDIDWDGEQFILVGSCRDADAGTDESIGIILKTADFRAVEKTAPLEYSSGRYYAEFYLVLPRNGKYMMIARKEGGLYRIITDFTIGGTSAVEIKTQPGAPYNVMNPQYSYISAAKSIDWALIYVCMHGIANSNTIAYHHKAFMISSDAVKDLELIDSSENTKAAAVFECKSSLYLQKLLPRENYSTHKVMESGETMTVSSGQSFMFTSGVYYNDCQLFINRHEMLVLRRGESFSDKGVNDLIEIAPEDAMQCIVKAFGMLYIFGAQGLVLRSSTETNNENAVMVQSLSAKRALAEAKNYSDARYKELEERIAALEALQQNI